MLRKEKSKNQLLKEIAQLRKKIAALEKIKVTHKKLEHHKEQEKILKLYERLRYLLTATSVVVYTSKISDDYGATFVSDNVVQIVGYKPENFTKNSSFWIDNIHPEDRKSILKELKKVLKEKYYIYEYRFRHKNGNYICIRDEMKLVCDKKGNPQEIVGYWTDITEHKKIKEELKESVELIKKFAEAATEGFVLFDSGLNVIDVNDYILEQFGKSRKDVIGLNILDVSFAAWETGRYDRYLEVIETGKPYFVEDVVTSDEFGNKHLFLKAFKVGSGMGMIVIDITEQKRAEMALQESEARFRSLYDSVHAGVIVQNTDGKIIHANNIACNILGIKEKINEASPVDSSWQLIDEEGNKVNDEENPLMITARIGKSVRNVVRGIFPNDPMKRRWLLFNTEPIMDPITRKLDEVIITFIDITERKKVEEALRESEERYRHIFENSPIGIGISTLDGNVITENKAMEEMTGYTLEEFRKINLADTYVSIKDREKLLKDLRKYGRVIDYPVRLKRKDGTPYKALLSISHVNIGNKDYLHTICQKIASNKNFARQANKKSMVPKKPRKNNCKTK